jgi:hypothetical protein
VEEAVRTIQKSTKLCPSDLEVKTQLAEIFLQIRRPDIAMALLGPPIGGEGELRGKTAVLRTIASKSLSDDIAMNEGQKIVMKQPWNDDAWLALGYQLSHS